jgi:hypothetical protein
MSIEGSIVTESTKERNRMKAAFAFLVAGLALLAPAVAVAHHSFAAEYDTKKPVTLKGTVTNVEWTNPPVPTCWSGRDGRGTL